MICSDYYRHKECSRWVRHLFGKGLTTMGSSSRRRERYGNHDPSTRISALGGGRQSLSPADLLLIRVQSLVSQKRYEAACALLINSPRDQRLHNARAVCLLRLGRAEQAVHLLRCLVLKPGGLLVRADIPTVYKTNFATALLLNDHPSGCSGLLNEVSDESNPAVIKLRLALKKWERGLNLWHRLWWRLGRIEPANRPVTIDFEPGDFYWGLAESQPFSINMLRLSETS